MELPLISVIVPVYNVEKYLDQCLRSITEQTYRNLEILLVDDGSPDTSGAICDAWAAKDERIRVIHQKNGGLSAARNAGLAAARGEWIGFVDSDDYISTEMYQHLYSLLDEETDIAECCWEKTFEDDMVFPGQKSAPIRCDSGKAMYCHIWDEMFWQIVCNKLYRRSVVGNICFPVGKINEDEFWTYQVIARANKLVHSDAVFYAYRQQQSSIMNKPYSVRRLDGLEAKLLRWGFLKEKMPELVYEAQVDLLLSCLYGMQGSLQSLSGEKLEEARAIIEKTMDQILPVPMDAERSIKRKALLYLAQKHLEPTAKILNFLIRIHILT